jgi:SET domain-containing protein
MPVSAEDVKVRRAATGLGLFTLRDIAAGRRIIQYLGDLIDDDEADRRGGKYLFDLGDGRAIDGRARSNLARYVNHSCRPNAVAYIKGSTVWIWSKRRIRAGEEITINYGRLYFDEHIRPNGCKCEACSAPAARKKSRS